MHFRDPWMDAIMYPVSLGLLLAFWLNPPPFFNLLGASLTCFLSFKRGVSFGVLGSLGVLWPLTMSRIPNSMDHSSCLLFCNRSVLYSLGASSSS